MTTLLELIAWTIFVAVISVLLHVLAIGMADADTDALIQVQEQRWWKVMEEELYT